MGDLVAVLIGASGLIAGEPYLLPDGANVTIGRSRSCDISLQRARRYLAVPEIERPFLADFNAVSRPHVRLEINAGKARLENLSTAGTFLNDQRFEGVLEIELSTTPANLRLSGNESFNLQLMSLPEFEKMVAMNSPIIPERPLPDLTPEGNTILTFDPLAKLPNQ